MFFDKFKVFEYGILLILLIITLSNISSLKSLSKDKKKLILLPISIVLGILYVSLDSKILRLGIYAYIAWYLAIPIIYLIVYEKFKSSYIKVFMFGFTLPILLWFLFLEIGSLILFKTW